MFIVVLFTIDKPWKQHKCPLNNEQIWYMVCIYKGYYSAIKKNEIMPFAETWMDLEIVIQSEVRQRKDKSCIISLICECKKKKIIQCTYLQNINRLTDM